MVAGAAPQKRRKLELRLRAKGYGEFAALANK